MRRTLLAALATLLLQQVASAGPTYTYVGKWQVDEGPVWNQVPPDGPLAYTGLEAAALLFGGSPSDYVISTADDTVANINHLAWYSVIAYGPISTDENYFNKYQGTIYGPTSGAPAGNVNNAASAYVHDTAIGNIYTNYAFKVQNGAIATPEPATITMFGVMLFGGAIGFRRRNLTA